MLTITIPAQPDRELFDEATNEFVTIKGLEKPKTLQLEHSLISLSKWESKWHKAYLKDTEKTAEEVLDYIKCMTLTSNVDPRVYDFLTEQNVNDILEYVKNPMTATCLPDNNTKKMGGDTVTSELIYYWMVALQIPFECEKWHLNRLITLIGVCNIKNSPPKKMSQKDIMSRNAAINAANRKRFSKK